MNPSDCNPVEWRANFRTRNIRRTLNSWTIRRKSLKKFTNISDPVPNDDIGDGLLPAGVSDVDTVLMQTNIAYHRRLLFAKDTRWLFHSSDSRVAEHYNTAIQSFLANRCTAKCIVS